MTKPHLHAEPYPIWGDESAVVELAVDWSARRVVRHTDPLSTARPASALAADAGPTITPSGIGGAEALRVFDTVLEPATRSQDDPLNLAYIAAAPTRAAIAFDLVTSAANIFGGLWEAGAGAIYAENEALAWIVGLLGWPATAGGCFVSGGTSGNLSALMTARETARTRRGGRPADGWQLACSSNAHSSIHSAARALDVDIVDIAVDGRGHLTGAALRAVLERSPNVFAVVASAGTTNEGVVDDLEDIADVCEEFGVWMHVDGAYGGAGLAAPSVRDLFAGIERADSFIVDPHKWLFAPYDCCALLYRDPQLARATHAQHASYLDHVDREVWNPSELALHLSRRARGLPFWFSLATHGTDRYRDAVEASLTTSRVVADAIRSSDHLRLVREPELSVLLFERVGWTQAQYLEWSNAAAHDGVILCVPTTWRGRSVLRLAFVNPATEAQRVIDVLETLR
ncbi:pyridoxal phosphate-dependent decarboxylase family protein [Lacisediminihabitans sp.]|jgi:glutamate/tyrosine decarboxylase-like PLP-dependent enzyme|uniref:pyridoxal phosphate-dependent decarboxylase family protein n=1 Tax=Lacisediminihabitans sp. TaxID=2787631 RepID=UPI002F944EB0